MSNDGLPKEEAVKKHNGRTNGAYTVGGDDRSWPSRGAAVSVAITLVTQRREANSRGVFKDDEKVARVARDDDGVITIEVLS